MALLKKLIRGRSRALPVGRGVPFRRPIRGRPTPPISIDRPPLTPSLGGAKPVQEGPLPLPVNPADDIVSALPVGPSIPFIPPLDTNELPTASPLPVPPPPPLPIGEQVPFIQQLIPENLRRGPFGNDRDRFKRPPPSLPPGGGKPGLIQNVNASGGFGQPLVPGSGTPPPQTGLTAAELLELSDEELQRYIPRETIGNMRRSYDATPSPEEFRKRLQAQLNLQPGDRGFGQRYSIRTQQTPEEIEASSQRKLLSKPVPEITGLNFREVPPRDYGYGPGIMPPLPDDFGMLEEKYERDIEPIEIPNLIGFDKPPSIGGIKNPDGTIRGSKPPSIERTLERLPSGPRRQDFMSIDRLGRDAMDILPPMPSPVAPIPPPMPPMTPPMTPRPRPRPVPMPQPMTPSMPMPQPMAPTIRPDMNMMGGARGGFSGAMRPTMMRAGGGGITKAIVDLQSRLK